MKDKDALGYYRKYERVGKTLSFEDKLYIEMASIIDAYLTSIHPFLTP